MGSRYQLRRVSNSRGSSTQSKAAECITLDRDQIKFGRNPDQVDVVLESSFYNNMISREHAEISRRRNEDGTISYYLADKSLNGTYVGETRVQNSVLLHPGDIIHFGHINGAAIHPGQFAPQPNAEFVYRTDPRRQTPLPPLI